MTDNDNNNASPKAAGAAEDNDPHRGPHPEVVSISAVDSPTQAVETTTTTTVPTTTSTPRGVGTTTTSRRGGGVLSSSDNFHHHHHHHPRGGLHNHHDDYLGSIGATTTTTTTGRSTDTPQHAYAGAGMVDSERDVDFDRDVLHRGVRDAGRWAYGTIFVEVWVWNDLGTQLIRPLGGWWLDPIFHIQQHEHLSQSGFLTTSSNSNANAATTNTDGTTFTSNEISSNSKCPLCRLTDRNLDTFEPPQPLMIGEGIPGAIWMELQHQGRINNTGANNSGGGGSPTSGGVGALRGGVSTRILNRNNLNNNNNSGDPSSPQSQHQYQKLIWRQVKDIADDPDQPFNPRLKLLAQRLVTAIGLAAGVPFDIMGSKGIVVYYARVGVSRQRLQHVDNENYLRAAANLIGSAYALRKPRQACVSRRHYELQQTKARVVRKIRQLGKEALLAKTIKTATGEEPPKMSTMKPLEVDEPLDQLEAQTIATSTSTSCLDHPYVQFVKNQTLRILHKFAGGGNQPPPAFCWSQTTWTFVGVLATLLVLTRTNVEIVKAWGPDYSIVMGPFGALMTLMFGLTGAPASQPRNALVGQAISMSIAIGISKIDALEPWMKQSFATALAVTTMVKLGVTHPPAGAAALLFANGKFGWFNVLTGLLGNLIAITAATFINDTNPERQYPTFWGFQHYYQVLHNLYDSLSSLPCCNYNKKMKNNNKDEEQEEVELKETMKEQEQPVTIKEEDCKHA